MTTDRGNDMATKDPVGAARKAVEDAEKAVRVEGERLASAVAKAERFEAEAAAIDPDADAKGFEKATGRLAELRAAADLCRTRETRAQAALQAAAAELATATNAGHRARLEVISGEIKTRETRALDALRRAVEAFGTEVAAVGEMASEGHRLVEELRRAGATDVLRPRASTAGWAGATPGHLAQLAGELLTQR